jgi:glycosyltransferase involved in cell wall biosynthesis
MNKSRIGLVTLLLPVESYGYFLSREIEKDENNIFIYTSNEEEKFPNKLINLKYVWSKNIKYIFEIYKEVKKDKLDLVHFQYEYNMYGNIITGAIFPFLLFILGMRNVKTVVTLHAIVKKNLINDALIDLFPGKNKYIFNKYTLKIFFIFIYKTINIFSHKTIVHTEYLKDILINDYNCDKNKIEVVPHGIVNRNVGSNIITSNYFLYFGYIVERKGLISVIDGFVKYKKKYNDANQLIIAGGAIKGQEESFEKIKHYINNLKRDDIIMAGFIDTDDIEKYYTQSIAVVLPAIISIAASGPLALALGYNKNVIFSNIENQNEEVINLKEGVAVNNSDWELGFEFVKKYPNMIKDFEKNIQNKVNQRDWNKIARMHKVIYTNIVKG